ncbi:MAG: hypothetical protein ACOC5T_06830 [Elusimicrobiota bacterium]
MSIQPDATKITMDFVWDDQENELSFDCRFHHTDEYGPTVSISERESNEYVAFPAKMYGEIANYLISSGIISNQAQVVVSEDQSNSPPPSASTEDMGGLPVPGVTKDDNNELSQDEQSLEIPPVTGEPMQSFTSTDSSVSDIDKTDSISKEDTEKYIKLRAKASKNAQKSNKSKIKTNHKMDAAPPPKKREPIMDLDMTKNIEFDNEQDQE